MLVGQRIQAIHDNVEVGAHRNDVIKLLGLDVHEPVQRLHGCIVVCGAWLYRLLHNNTVDKTQRVPPRMTGNRLRIDGKGAHEMLTSR
jgi:hypothetical protein